MLINEDSHVEVERVEENEREYEIRKLKYEGVAVGVMLFIIGRRALP